LFLLGAGSPDPIAMPQAFYFHLEGLTSVQDEHGLKLPDPKHANDHSRTTASKTRMGSRVRDPSVVVVDERALRFIESPSFQKGHSVIVVEGHNAKLWTRIVRR